MAITIFSKDYTDGATEEFREWMSSHPDDLYLNERRPGDYMLHSAKCPQLAYEVKASLASAKKICAPTAQELERFVAVDPGATLTWCTVCATQRNAGGNGA
jgi:hypothetical protein